MEKYFNYFCSLTNVNLTEFLNCAHKNNPKPFKVIAIIPKQISYIGYVVQVEIVCEYL